MWRDTSPDRGSLQPAVLRVRLSVLANHTSTSDDYWFCVWDGWDGFVPSQQMPDASPGAWARPGVRLPGREYSFARGGLNAALHLQDTDEARGPRSSRPICSDQTDRAWCVAFEINFDSTLIAGSEYLAAQLMRTDILKTRRESNPTLLSPKTQTFSTRSTDSMRPTERSPQ
jgi:hypothetical protein